MFQIISLTDQNPSLTSHNTLNYIQGEALHDLLLAPSLFLPPLSSSPNSLQIHWSSSYFSNMPNMLLSQDLCIVILSTWNDLSLEICLAVICLYMAQRPTTICLTPYLNSWFPGESLWLFQSYSLSLEESVLPWVSHQSQEESRMVQNSYLDPVLQHKL